MYMCRHIRYNWLWHTEPIKQLPLICKGRYFCSVYPSSGRYVLIVYSHWSQGFRDPATEGFLDVPTFNMTKQKNVDCHHFTPLGAIFETSRKKYVAIPATSQEKPTSWEGPKFPFWNEIVCIYIYMHVYRISIYNHKYYILYNMLYHLSIHFILHWHSQVKTNCPEKNPKASITKAETYHNSPTLRNGCHA